MGGMPAYPNSHTRLFVYLAAPAKLVESYVDCRMVYKVRLKRTRPHESQSRSFTLQAK